MKILFAITISAIAFSGAALADTVQIDAGAQFTTPSGGISASNTYHFKGPQEIVFDFAGKTCKLNGSAQGSVPMGCNYVVSLSPSGKLSGALLSGNQVCTQSNQVAMSCK